MNKSLSLLAVGLFSCFLLSSPVFADEVLLDHKGVNLRADLNLADDKKLEDGVVMMLHGTLAHNRMEIMSTVSELLNDAGYNTLAVNLSFAIDKRAEGMLDCGVEHRHLHEDAVYELAAWTNWLKQEGAGKVAIWGHSRGGNQVAWFASERDSDDLLSQFILVAPATYSAEKAAAGYKKNYGKPLAEVMAEARKLIEADKGSTLMNVPGFVYCENATASAEAFVSYGKSDARKNTPDLLNKISKPTLLVIGSADEVVADLSKQLEGFSQDNVRMETIDGAGHFFRDLYADDMVEMIDGFLAW